MLRREMSDEFERTLKEAAVAYTRNYPRTILEGLKKSTKNLSPYNRCQDRDSKQAPF
jgi:hypothetical protein